MRRCLEEFSGSAIALGPLELMDNMFTVLYPALRVQDTFNKASFIEAASFT